jgi:uncharacterized protein YutE (UPF0331/DUF86 family)
MDKSAIDTQSILQKLERLSAERKKLQARSSLSYQEFMETPLVQDAVSYSFIVAIQVCLDIAAHLVSALGLQKPTSRADLFLALADAKILPQDLSLRLIQMSGFRNILAHEYQQVDLSLVYNALEHHLADLDEFKGSIINFLEEENEGVNS